MKSSRSLWVSGLVFSVKCLLVLRSYIQSLVVWGSGEPGLLSKNSTLALTPWA